MKFDVPIVFFIFKRTEKSLMIIDRIAQVRPAKLYLISDAARGGREEEQKLVDECREAVLRRIDWDCEVVKDFAETNQGCYERIGLGALRVFEREPRAFFLEDDNLPEVSFFEYCRELLDRYADDPDVLWICGTNYLERYESASGSDYVFTRHMHPCGWASWAHKFTADYDHDFSQLTPENLRRIRSGYANQRLYRRDVANWKYELENQRHTGKFSSWDYQMSFSIRLHNRIGIVPCRNQIANIGVDSFSAHGGSSMNMVMTKRFCGMKSFPLDFPLRHPETTAVDAEFERAVDKIVIPPRWLVLKASAYSKTALLARKIFRIPPDQSIHKTLLKRIKP